jgi:dTDP-4-amino-4,6-dideoxygalactose transaminase
MPPIALLDLQAEFRLFEDEVLSVVHEVLASQQFIGGPAVRALEEALARRVGCAHAVAVSSGTDALLATLMALGIGPGDEVIVPAFTFSATASVVVRVGATPVFVDVRPDTFNIDPQGIRRAITPRTRAVIPVHLFGLCADADALTEAVKGSGAAIVEDAAQAIGARYHGRAAGTFGRAACLSFYPTKNLGGFGEGGMVLTDDAALCDTLRQVRNHGEAQRYACERIGANFRLDTMKAAILLVKLRYLDRFTARRRRNADGYHAWLAGTEVRTPVVPEGHEPVYHQYTVLAPRREALRSYLSDHGISTAVYYPIPLHLQKPFASLGNRAGDLPVAEDLSGRVVSLPCHPMLTDEDVYEVSRHIHAFYGTSPPARDALPPTGAPHPDRAKP